MEEPIAIPLSKRKLWLSLFLSCCFVALGYWLWQRVPQYEGFKAVKAQFGAWSCMIVFGLRVLILIFKLLDKRAGLVINTKGIYRMGLFNYHQPILWEHITHTSVTEIKRTKLLLIHVDNVEEELARMTPLTRWFQRLTIASTGTPFSVSSAALQGSFTDLQALIERGIERQHQLHEA
ncbi:MAG TPA: STM3941 family protein [Flavobacteriales bacterium]|nr:STM3941 family protein [Flavobacteriales bacterium]